MNLKAPGLVGRAIGPPAPGPDPAAAAAAAAAWARPHGVTSHGDRDRLGLGARACDHRQ